VFLTGMSLNFWKIGVNTIGVIGKREIKLFKEWSPKS
jgi:hypothetical protein